MRSAHARGIQGQKLVSFAQGGDVVIGSGEIEEQHALFVIFHAIAG